MKVVWTPEAQSHLDGIYQYITSDAPFYAQGVVDKLTRRSQQLVDHPYSGRVVPAFDDRNLRELIVYPYRLIYRVMTDRIDVIAVFHGAQRLPESL
jgi:addiction module RelE/StbE family toxin